MITSAKVKKRRGSRVEKNRCLLNKFWEQEKWVKKGFEPIKFEVKGTTERSEQFCPN